MPIRIRNKLNNAASFLATFQSSTSQFAPLTAGEAVCWMQSDIAVINATQAVATALDPGDTRTLSFRVGTGTVGSTLVLSDAALNVRGLIGATLTAAGSTSQSEAQIMRQLDGGTPPLQASRIAFFYRDADDDDRSWHGVGSASFNQSINATAEYMGFEMNRSTATEAISRHIMPVAGVMGPFVGLAGSAAGTTHEIAVMINGVATVLGSVSGSATQLINILTPIAIAASDEVSFRFVRTAGTGTTFVVDMQVGFVPTTP